MGELIEKILTHGVFAIVSVAEGFIILYLFRQREALTDRMVAKAEKDAEKNAELAARTQAMLEALTSRVRPRSTSDE